MSYARLGTADPSTEESSNPLHALTTSRGYMRVPTADVRMYVHQTLLAMAIGFGIGVGVGAMFGQVGVKAPTAARLIGNRRRRRR